MNIKHNPLKQFPEQPNGRAPIQKPFDPSDLIPMPEHWATPLANPVAESTSPSRDPSSLGSGGRSILIAEDDQNSSLALKVTLEKAGYAPVIARDGLEAMAALRGPNPPNIAVLDWKMPGMDGLEVCRRVRDRKDRNNALYIIFLSGRATTENIVEALEAGADDFLAKPFKSPELVARIHVGLRVVSLHNALGHKVKELEHALLEIKALRAQSSDWL